MIKEVRNFLIKNGIEANEARAEAELIVCAVSGYTLEQIFAGAEISESMAEKIRFAAKKRVETGAPIQHILGFAYFMGDRFYVNDKVLIPRPETELLVRAAADAVRRRYAGQANKGISILDIGTGSGCIACEISKLLQDIDLEIMGVDISMDALRVAIKNMEILGCQRRVIFRKSDIYSGLREIDKFDIIVSNPPYIPIYLKDTLQDEVKNFDPDLALFTEDKDGVEFYKKILAGAKRHLKLNGSVLFEIGFNDGISQAPIVAEIAKQYGFKLEFINKDLAGIERVICFMG